MRGSSPCLVSRRMRPSAAERYWVGSTPKARKARRQAASDGTSLREVSPIRAMTSACAASNAAARPGGVGPFATPLARITPPTIPGNRSTIGGS